MTAQLTARQTDCLITALRHGQDLDAAADGLGIDLSAVWARARTDTRLTIALAGRDPDGSEEKSRTAHADFLRLLALGLTPSRAELIVGVSSTSGWRRDPGFARACDAVAATSVPYGDNRRLRLTPARVARFLEELSRAGTTVLAASAAVGVTAAAIYQRRRRDTDFADAMDQARATARGQAPVGGR